MIARTPLLGCLSLVLALPAAAQERSSDTHLDDFAIPGAETGVTVQQLGSSEEEAFQPVSSLDGDRQLGIPGPAPTEARAIAQVSSGAGADPSPQVSTAGERDVAAGAISSPRDSRPRGVARLGGEDRCDPQQEAERLAECQRILELRAAEFQATEPPKLSAEQALLAERGDSIELLASTSSDLRVKLAGGSDPSAESRANQELASIVLDQQPALQGAGIPAPIDQSLAEDVVELIEGLRALPSMGTP